MKSEANTETQKINNSGLKEEKGRGQVIFQSNRITNGKWRGFTLIQSKIFISIIDKLQKAINAGMHGTDWRQLPLFEYDKEMRIKISIPLKEICRPDQYKQIHSNAAELMSINLYFESKDKKYDIIETLFSRFEIPKLENGIKVMTILINRTSAERLIEIDKNINGLPINYTKYLKSVALSAKNKYTYKLYMIIASWKIKGGFRISLSELKEKLGIHPNEYKQYSHFKNRVLIPVQAELKKNADCWFNCSEKNFEETEKQTGKVIFFNFKVITKVDKESADNKFNYIRNLLIMHASFTDVHLMEIASIFGDSTDYSEISFKVVELIEYVRDKSNQVENKQAYIIKSLKNAFL